MTTALNISEQLVTDQHHYELIYAIALEAMSRFAKCNATDDFCLQHCKGGTIVFGGCNRVVWTAQGFRLDKSNCTDDFVTTWTENYS
jgi:hypothetical protein